ncbi:hypothetical protein OHA98_05530 [Streptomyces sp. NBC_00654]|uniref:hypothetical protein n=1 Tax=Streptomyces sp. NBC_00654 TaxID=2975799 RepID=UPI00224EEC1C|nr:hypothetical protein [Streptomyces sp. NBC_00654]MCX4964282.1 hypothetical protein [Streptomyces sp. NBC_00654]
MPTSEHEARPQPQPAQSPKPRTTPSALSMKDLLASCAAATAVSTPPACAEGEPDGGAVTGVRRDAA